MRYYYPCLLCGQKVACLKKTKSYRPILPKIVLGVLPGEPVDPQPAQLVSGTMMAAIADGVQEAIKEARKHHEIEDQNTPLDLSPSSTLYPRQ